MGFSAVDGGITLFFEQGGQPKHLGEGFFHPVLDFFFRQGKMGGSGRSGSCRQDAGLRPWFGHAGASSS